ncbi:MAG: hypothetical protein GX047_08860 [Firmicutes bacterium]|nr:hypothetical protein [Bacillota bacterium]
MFKRRMTRTKRTITILVALTLIVTGQLILRQREEVDLELYPQLIPQVLPAISTDQSVIVHDPYDYPGEYYKAQLHMHTNKSLDGKWSTETAVNAYYEAGYTYLAITDHDRVTLFDGINDPNFVIIAGEENTVPWPFWPLGAHMLRLFVDSPQRSGNAQTRISSAVRADGIAGIAHPNWSGNLTTGKWTLPQMLALHDYTLVEVYNPHSNSRKDTATWHELIRRLGPEISVWAIAVDDAHDENLFNRGWVMVKTEGVSEEALKEALLRGSFYASTGPTVVFGVEDGVITARIEGDEPAEISFIAGNGEVVYSITSTEGSYEPKGNEGFIRVEVETKRGKRAWSQPFWLEVGEAL